MPWFLRHGVPISTRLQAKLLLSFEWNSRETYLRSLSRALRNLLRGSPAVSAFNGGFVDSFVDKSRGKIFVTVDGKLECPIRNRDACTYILDRFFELVVRYRDSDTLLCAGSEFPLIVKSPQGGHFVIINTARCFAAQMVCLALLGIFDLGETPESFVCLP